MARFFSDCTTRPKLADFLLGFLFSFSFYFRYSLYTEHYHLVFLLIGLIASVLICLSRPLISNLCLRKLCLRDPTKKKVLADSIIVFFVMLVLLVFVFYKTSFPVSPTPDAKYQKAQIDGIIPYNNIHAFGHTLFMKILLSGAGNYTFVIFAHLILIAFLFALFSSFFSEKSVPLVFQLILYITCSLLLLRSLKVYYFPIKDTPYTVLVGFFTYYLMLYAEDRDCSLIRIILFAVLLALIPLFRQNGILISLFFLFWFSVLLIQSGEYRKLAILFAVFAIIMCVAYGYFYLVLHASRPSNGFSIQVFGYGIASAAHDNPTAAELEKIGSLLPLSVIEEHWSDVLPLDLFWFPDETVSNPELCVFNNSFVIALGAHKLECIKLYFQLLPNHFRACLHAVLSGTKFIWSQHEYDCFYVYNNISLMITLGIVASARIKKRFISLLPFIPVLINIFSIAISTVTNEQRYLLPTFTLFPFLLLYLFCLPNQDVSSKQINIKKII